MKRIISIAVCSLAIVSNAGAQGLGDILGTILGVVKEVSSAIPEGNESSVGLPQQNLSKWGIASANFSGITPLGDGPAAGPKAPGSANLLRIQTASVIYCRIAEIQRLPRAFPEARHEK